MKNYTTREGDEYHYEFGNHNGIPCVYIVYHRESDGTRVPYRYDTKWHEYWIYVPELDLYRCNVSI